jgi:hypothetical protein
MGEILSLWTCKKVKAEVKVKIKLKVKVKAKVKVKVKFTLEQATKAQNGSTYKALFFL